MNGLDGRGRWRSALAGAAALGAFALALGGCASGRSSDAQRPAASALGRETAPSAALLGERCCPLIEGTSVIVVLEGASAGERHTLRDAPAESEERWTRSRATERGEPVTEETFVRSEDGAVALERSVSHPDRVITVFDPPMVVAPASLAPGETFRQELTIRVHPLENPETLRDEGPATQELVYETDQVVRSGALEVGAARVRQSFQAKLRSANVTTETTMWHAREGESGVAGGLAARQTRETATFLGLTVRDVREFWVIDAPR